MNRIERIFGELRESQSRGEGRGKAVMPYVTVGDPDLETTGMLLPALARQGASVCELGFPFSDPIADGPVIERSMHYALSHGLKVGEVFEMVSRVRREGLEMGLVGMVSYSIVHRYGEDRFVGDAKDAGFDGFIVPDLMLEESGGFAEKARSAGMVLSMLVSPTTDMARAKAIAARSSGFLYVVARAGITGEGREMSSGVGERVRALRGVTDLPIAVGFGVSDSRHVEHVLEEADAAIVGSALVRRIGEHRNEGREAVVSAVEGFVGDLCEGLK